MKKLLGVVVLLLTGVSPAAAALVWQVTTAATCTAASTPLPCCVSASAAQNGACNPVRMNFGQYFEVLATLRMTGTSSTFCTANVTPLPCCTGAGTGTCAYTLSNGAEGCDQSVSAVSCGDHLAASEFAKLGLNTVEHAVCWPAARTSDGSGTGFGGRQVALARNRRTATALMGTALTVKFWNVGATGTSPQELGQNTTVATGELYTCLLFGR